MKAIVLAAGKGQRLGKITKAMPKPMLTVRGEVILGHNIRWLKKYGIKDIYLNLHYLPEVIKGFLGNGKKFGVKVHYLYESKLLGTSGSVKKIAQGWGGNFLVIYGDNFYPLGYNIKGMIDFSLQNDSLVTVGLYKKKNELSKSGVALLDRSNLITSFLEKPKLNSRNSKIINSGWINTGIYMLNNKILSFIPDGYSDFGKEIFPTLLKNNILVYGYIFKQKLTAIDTVALYKKVLK
jgi:NDP-sugar pyrophosphorylase family protein